VVCLWNSVLILEYEPEICQYETGLPTTGSRILVGNSEIYVCVCVCARVYIYIYIEREREREREREGSEKFLSAETIPTHISILRCGRRSSVT
jgi:hypothetical protein